MIEFLQHIGGIVAVIVSLFAIVTVSVLIACGGSLLAIKIIEWIGGAFCG